MSVISRIESMMEDYSSAEKKLANYIIGNIEKVPTMTANELAEASGLSAPTVVRFQKNRFSKSDGLQNHDFNRTTDWNR